MQLTLSLFNLRHFLLTSTGANHGRLSNNGSTDETVAIVEQYQEKLSNLRIVDSSDQRGQHTPGMLAYWLLLATH